MKTQIDDVLGVRSMRLPCWRIYHWGLILQNCLAVD